MAQALMTDRDQSLSSLLRSFTVRLETAGVDSPRLSAEILCAFVLRLDRSGLLKNLLLEPDFRVAPEQAQVMAALVDRRENGEPVAYIVGSKEFYGRDFRVSPATLIPRPDTETLVDAALEFVRREGRVQGRFLDLGTGSGAIAVTLALELPAWSGLALDICDDAVRMAMDNAARLGASNIVVRRDDFLTVRFDSASFDLVVSNPPYVSEAEYAAVSPEIRDFEPRTALVPPSAQASGLEHLTVLIDRATDWLRPGGVLLLEMGHTQGPALLRWAEGRRPTDAARSTGRAVGDGPPVWKDCRILHDLAGLPRVFSARKG